MPTIQPIKILVEAHHFPGPIHSPDLTDQKWLSPGGGKPDRPSHGWSGRRKCQRQEEGGRGRPGAHLPLFVHALQSRAETHHLVRQLARLRMDHYYHHHCQLRRHGSGRQAALRGQDGSLPANGKKIPSYLFSNQTGISRQILILILAVPKISG